MNKELAEKINEIKSVKKNNRNLKKEIKKFNKTSRRIEDTYKQWIK